MKIHIQVAHIATRPAAKALAPALKQSSPSLGHHCFDGTFTMKKSKLFLHISRHESGKHWTRRKGWSMHSTNSENATHYFWWCFNGPIVPVVRIVLRLAFCSMDAVQLCLLCCSWTFGEPSLGKKVLALVVSSICKIGIEVTLINYITIFMYVYI